MRSFYLLVCVCVLACLTLLPGDCWKCAGGVTAAGRAVTATNQRNSVCLIHVRAVRRPGCDPIRKPAVHVFLTTVVYHNIWLHWNNQTNKHVFCKLLNVNKRVYFYPKLTSWMCVSVPTVLEQWEEELQFLAKYQQYFYKFDKLRLPFAGVSVKLCEAQTRRC